jgi:pilus assembly protein Flp/PilA
MKARRRDETGATAIEYGLVAIAVAAAVVAAVFLLGDVFTDIFTDSCDTISTLYDGSSC